jgi:hypothetical protein
MGISAPFSVFCFARSAIGGGYCVMPTCIYCGSQAGSREHIYPSWLVEALARDPRGLDLPAPMRIWRDGVQIRVLQGKVRPRKTFEFTTKVCKACNSGWMNRIDDRVRPHLEPMIAGRQTALAPAAQAAVAAWMTKVTITRFAAEHRPFVKPAWTAQLRTTETALPDWHVCVGKYVGAQPLWGSMHDLSLFDSDGVTVIDRGVIATLLVGYVALQVFHLSGLSVQEHPAVPMLRIGPATERELKWPPPDHFTDETLPAFADRFVRGLNRLSAPHTESH